MIHSRRYAFAVSTERADPATAVPRPSGGRRSEPLDRRHIERRELVSRWLLPAVERLLDEESYPALTVEQMAAEAEISRSSFYNYFEDKGDLLRALTDDVMSKSLDASRVWWMLPPNAGKEELRGALRHLVEVYTPHAVLMRAVSETISHDSRVRAEYLDYMANGVAGIAEYVRAGQAAGAIRPDLDATAVGEWFTWGFERGLLQLSLRSSTFDPERMVTAMVDILWKALH